MTLEQFGSLDQEMVDAPSVNAFKGRLDKIRQARVDFSWTNPLSPAGSDWQLHMFVTVELLLLK